MTSEALNSEVLIFYFLVNFQNAVGVENVHLARFGTIIPKEPPLYLLQQEGFSPPELLKLCS